MRKGWKVVPSKENSRCKIPKGRKQNIEITKDKLNCRLQTLSILQGQKEGGLKFRFLFVCLFWRWKEDK